MNKYARKGQDGYWQRKPDRRARVLQSLGIYNDGPCFYIKQDSYYKSLYWWEHLPGYTRPDVLVLTDKYYVGSTASSLSRYRYKEHELRLTGIKSFPCPAKDRRLYEQAAMNYLEELGVPLSNANRATSNKAPYTILPVEAIEYCKMLARAQRGDFI